MKKLLMLGLFAGVPFAYQTSSVPPGPPKPARSQPAKVTKAVSEFRKAGVIDSIVEEAIESGQLPGAVVVVGHKGRVVLRKAYGNRAVAPRREPMTLDTIFDIASLTKVVATTSAIAKLVEDGQIRINEKVTTYIPEFQGGKSDITLRHLLTHFSGLRPDVDLEPAWAGYERGIQLAAVDTPTGLPEARFIYSDINFVLLGEVVSRVSKKTLPEYVEEKIFRPLGMTETMFAPPPKLLRRIAPTEILKGAATPLRGVVHDPTARYMGGVAGHAGVFSTASDLSKFAEMMLGMGKRDGVRVFSPLTVRKFTTPQGPEGQPVLRGFGWDINSPFSGSRGDLFPVGSYGHTGFTGTSMWMDPSTDTYVILLSNSVHPYFTEAITSLRSRVASVAAAGLDLDAADPGAEPGSAPGVAPPQKSAARTGAVLNGIDVLVAERPAEFKGKRVGLITNHTGTTRNGRRNIDAMVEAGFNLRALYSPEHGLAGKEDQENIGHARDAGTGLPIWSLYSGQNRRPSDEMLRDIDVLMFDIQDIGTRFYTYYCTMAYAMQEAAKRNIEFVVLDRPNPINGVQVEGPMLDPALRSFIGCFELPVRHGMTVGEIAGMINAASNPKAKLQVVEMRGWQRTDWFDSTGLEWIDPSPNMRNLTAALLYPGIGMLEGGKVYSVGRGTAAPFEQVGAEWLKGRRLASYLNSRSIPGVRVYATRFQPDSSNFSGKTIEGIRFVITDRDSFNSVRLGLEVGSAIAKLFPGMMDWTANDKLTGDKSVLRQLRAGEDPSRIEHQFAAALLQFQRDRTKYLLY